MENDLIETVLAVMANPKSCELEVFITEGSVPETMDRLQRMLPPHLAYHLQMVQRCWPPLLRLPPSLQHYRPTNLM